LLFISSPCSLFRSFFHNSYSITTQHDTTQHTYSCKYSGSLPGIETAQPTDADVTTALSAMAIQDDGSTHLDYFIQAYRAGDFPFYADYAVHRATEPLAGPRQIVVTK
jgi:hypothetical protein